MTSYIHSEFNRPLLMKFPIRLHKGFELIVTSDRRNSYVPGGPKVMNVDSSNLSSFIKIKRPKEDAVFGRQIRKVCKQRIEIHNLVLDGSH